MFLNLSLKYKTAHQLNELNLFKDLLVQLIGCFFINYFESKL